MDEERARSLLDAERARVQELLAVLGADELAERAGSGELTDAGDQAQELTAQGTDGLVADDLRQRLAALDRAERRLEAGTYGRSARSGIAIPDERLEADPAAELTVEEAREAERR
jgi:DnaK suppressor protein